MTAATATILVESLDDIEASVRRLHPELASPALLSEVLRMFLALVECQRKLIEIVGSMDTQNDE